jgi:hypothetical protein
MWWVYFSLMASTWLFAILVKLAYPEENKRVGPGAILFGGILFPIWWLCFLHNHKQQQSKPKK